MKRIKLGLLCLVLVLVGCNKKVNPQPFVVTEQNFSSTAQWTTFLSSELTDSECYFAETLIANSTKITQTETTLVCEIPDVAFGLQQLVQEQNFQTTIQSLLQGKEEEKIYPYVLGRVLDVSTAKKQVERSASLNAQGIYDDTEFLETLVREELSTVDSFVQENLQTSQEKEEIPKPVQYRTVKVGETCFVRYKGAKLLLKVNSVSLAQDIAQGCSFDSKYQPVRIDATFVLLSMKDVMVSAPFIGLTREGLQCITNAVFDGVLDNQALAQGEQCQISTVVFCDRGGSVGFYDPKTHYFVKLEN